MVQTIDLILSGEERPSAAMRLIYTAGPLFAEKPFDSVSTRELAKAAKVNLSAIAYHFGSKAGLYRSVLETIVHELSPIRTPLISGLEKGRREADGDPALLARLLVNFAEILIRGVTSPDNPRWRMKLAIRELQHPSECADILMSGHVNPMHDALGELIGDIRQQPAKSADVILLTHTVMFACLQYGLNEAFVCRRIGWPSYGAAQVDDIVRTMKPVILNMVGLNAIDFEKSGA